jgi:diacylglycerol diphosphate phosphatase / phosphatidate phosphatase
VGSLLGITLAYFSYRQYYPSLASELSHKPYSPRIQREPEELLPVHRDQAQDHPAEARIENGAVPVASVSGSNGKEPVTSEV